MSEGIYVGLNGGVKRLANELWGVPFGISSYILGRFLTEVWKGSATYDKKEKERAEKVVKEMVRMFDNDGHSGGSACVATQNLLSVMGCGAVKEAEFKGYFEQQKKDATFNTWSLLISLEKQTKEEKEKSKGPKKWGDKQEKKK